MRLYLFLSLVVSLASAKVFNKCELANRLKSSGTPDAIKNDYETWACIASKHSAYNTNDIKKDETKVETEAFGTAYGLFHISNKHWCKETDPVHYGGNDSENRCNIDCSKLMDDDITDDLECVATILKENEGTSWGGINSWNPHAEICQGGFDIGGCMDFDKSNKDFWKEGACVFPESCGNDDLRGDVCYPCDYSDHESATSQNLVVLKKDQVNCCENGNSSCSLEGEAAMESARKRRHTSYGANLLGSKDNALPYGHGYGFGQYKEALTHYRKRCSVGSGYPVPYGAAAPLTYPCISEVASYDIGCDDASDDCDRDEIKMEDNSGCHKVLSNGPCGIEGIVLVNKTTKMGFCATRLCGPDRIFLEGTQKCHDPRDPGFCQRSDHILYTNMYGEPVCGCHNGYYEKDSKCRQILTETDICPKDEVFWFETFRKPPTCLPDPCKGDNIGRPANQLPFAPYKNGKCYQIASQPLEICRPDQFYFLDMETLEGFCERMDEAAIVYTPEEFVRAKKLFGPFIPKGPVQSGDNILIPPASTSRVFWNPVQPVLNTVVAPPMKLIYPQPVQNIILANHYQPEVIHVKGSISNIGLSKPPIFAGYGHAAFGMTTGGAKERKRRTPWAGPGRYANNNYTNLVQCQSGLITNGNGNCNHVVSGTTQQYQAGPAAIPIAINHAAAQACHWHYNHQRQCGGTAF